MSAYLSSQDMPYVLFVRDLDVRELEVALPDWIRESKVLFLESPNAIADDHPIELVNLAGIRAIRVTVSKPPGSGPVREVNGPPLLQ